MTSTSPGRHQHAKAHRPRLVLSRHIHERHGLNGWLAIQITRWVGTMGCAYLFAALAFVSLPAAATSGNVVIIVAWISQTFLQLTLLAVIMVGQKVQAAADDERAQADHETLSAVHHLVSITHTLLSDVSADLEKRR